MNEPDERAPPTAFAKAIDRVTQLEAELESASDATTATDALERARAVLHRWVDSVSAVVATPGAGRVVLIHADGSESRVASPQLPMLLAEPVRWD
jgi:hypothetical protein